MCTWDGSLKERQIKRLINNGYTEAQKSKYAYSVYSTKVYKLILSWGMRLSFGYIITAEIHGVYMTTFNAGKQLHEINSTS